MAKTAFIFPGQGAQYVGMAKDFYDKYEECRKIIDEADELMDFDLKAIMFEENELINKQSIHRRPCLQLNAVSLRQLNLRVSKLILLPA